MKKTNINEFLNCRKVEQFLMAYIDKELNTLSRLRFQIHLAMCADCRNYLYEYEKAVILGKKVFSDPNEFAAGKVPDGIINAILDATKVS